MCFTAITLYATGDKILLNLKAESKSDSGGKGTWEQNKNH